MSKRGIRIIPKAKDPITPFVTSVSPKKWHLKAAIAKNRETGESGEVTYYDPNRETFAILRDDSLTGVHYYTIWGPAEREVADEIRALGPTYSEDELFTWWDRAVGAGCTVEAPYERQFWGDDWGLLRDPFGLLWGVMQPGPEG